MGEELKWLAERLRPIFEQHRVARAIGFGSLVRGEASRRSDLDLIVVMDTDKRFLDRYDGLLAPLARAVPERAVDLMIYTPEELARLASRRFIAAALREGEIIKFYIPTCYPNLQIAKSRCMAMANRRAISRSSPMRWRGRCARRGAARRARCTTSVAARA